MTNTRKPSLVEITKNEEPQPEPEMEWDFEDQSSTTSEEEESTNPMDHISNAELLLEKMLKKYLPEYVIEKIVTEVNNSASNVVSGKATFDHEIDYEFEDKLWFRDALVLALGLEAEKRMKKGDQEMTLSLIRAIFASIPNLHEDNDVCTEKGLSCVLEIIPVYSCLASLLVTSISPLVFIEQLEVQAKQKFVGTADHRFFVIMNEKLWPCFSTLYVLGKMGVDFSQFETTPFLGDGFVPSTEECDEKDVVHDRPYILNQIATMIHLYPEISW
jgi:hypothetical protein